MKEQEKQNQSQTSYGIPNTQSPDHTGKYNPNLSPPMHPSPSYYQTGIVNPRQGKSGRLALACLLLSILGFGTGIFLIGLALDILAIILGIIALTNSFPRKGLAVSGIVISALSILLTVFFYFAVGGGSFFRFAIPDPNSVSVMHQPTEDELRRSEKLMKQIIYTAYKSWNGVIVTFENDNAVEVDLTVYVTYYDEKGKILSIREGYLWECAANSKAALQISPPTTEIMMLFPTIITK